MNSKHFPAADCTYYGRLAYWMTTSKKEARYATAHYDNWTAVTAWDRYFRGIIAAKDGYYDTGVWPGMPIVPTKRR